MSPSPHEALHRELEKRLKELDWIETPYLRMAMDTHDEWHDYVEELKKIPLKLVNGEIEKPRIVNGQLVFIWPKEPLDSESNWKRMANFSKNNA